MATPARVSGAADDTASAFVVRIAVHNSPEAAEPTWRELAERGVHTPYQRFEWIALWSRHLAAEAGVTPWIVTGHFADGTPAFLLPLGLQRSGLVTIARFLGGKHANYNFGIWDRTFAAGLDEDAVRALVHQIGAQPGAPDALVLTNQPLAWDGLANPLALLPHQPSPSHGYRLPLGASGEDVVSHFSSTLRSDIRRKLRKLAPLPGFAYVRVSEPAQIDRLLDAFLAQKAARFAEQGLENVFAGEAMKTFLSEATRTGLHEGRPVIELHALVTDHEVLAILGGVSGGGRFSAMFNSHTLGEHSRGSPGIQLAERAIRECADRGLAMFDLGVGEAGYKARICSEAETLFDSFVPLTPLGRLAALTARSAADVKRRIKGSPQLWSLVQRARRYSARSLKQNEPPAH